MQSFRNANRYSFVCPHFNVRMNMYCIHELHVCMNVYACVCVYMYIYLCMYCICMCICMYICICICVYIYLNEWRSTRIYDCMHVCMYVRMCLYVYYVNMILEQRMRVCIM